jgi:argininosuccinate synthase
LLRLRQCAVEGFTGIFNLFAHRFCAGLALQSFVTESQKNVTGTVRVKLYKGNILIAGRKSPVSPYNPHIAAMEADPTQAYNQDDATGFIRLNALRLKVKAKVRSAA